jgi:hypothetical protein
VSEATGTECKFVFEKNVQQCRNALRMRIRTKRRSLPTGSLVEVRQIARPAVMHSQHRYTRFPRAKDSTMSLQDVSKYVNHCMG